MSGPDFIRLLLLSAIWGGSFLFMRIAVPEFGPIALIWIRVTVATLFLLPLVRKKHILEIASHPFKLAVSALLNCAIPWLLLAYAVLTLEAGFTSLLNAATPFFAAVVGYVWMRSSLSVSQSIGLFVGFIGVAILASDRLDFSASGQGFPILATLGAAFCYGFVGHHVKRYLSHLSSTSVTIGNLGIASISLLPFLFRWPPAELPSTRSIICALALAILSTAIAFLLLFDILRRNRATAVSTVTYIIPVFGILFGWLFLKEEITLRMVMGMVVAFVGAALVTQLLKLPSSGEVVE